MLELSLQCRWNGGGVQSSVASRYVHCSVYVLSTVDSNCMYISINIIFQRCKILRQHCTDWLTI